MKDAADDRDGTHKERNRECEEYVVLLFFFCIVNSVLSFLNLSINLWKHLDRSQFYFIGRGDHKMRKEEKKKLPKKNSNQKHSLNSLTHFLKQLNV